MNSQIAAPICTGDASVAGPIHHIEIILPEDAAASGAQMFRDLFHAANDLITSSRYQTSVRCLSTPLTRNLGGQTRHTVIFLGNIHSRWQVSGPDRSRLQQTLRHASRTVLIGGAVFLLSATGQNHLHPLAIHSNFSAAADEEDLRSAPQGQHVASSGGVGSATSPFAALHLLLQIIEDDHGSFIADAVSEYVGLADPSMNLKSKVALHLLQRAHGDRLISRILDLMLDNIEEPRLIRDLAQRTNVSTRKLERRFQEKARTTPLAVYRRLRIERAHQLIVHSSLPLSEIVVATGFTSLSNFSYWCKRELGSSPKVLRQRAFAS